MTLVCGLRWRFILCYGQERGFHTPAPPWEYLCQNERGPGLPHHDAGVFGLEFRLDMDGHDAAFDERLEARLDAVAHIVRL